MGTWMLIGGDQIGEGWRPRFATREGCFPCPENLKSVQSSSDLRPITIFKDVSCNGNALYYIIYDQDIESGKGYEQDHNRSTCLAYKYQYLSCTEDCGTVLRSNHKYNIVIACERGMCCFRRSF
jgi:hypothetical protein